MILLCFTDSTDPVIDILIHKIINTVYKNNNNNNKLDVSVYKTQTLL